MKINFILPFTYCTGGIKIAFEYANRLKEKGHDIIIYIPMVAYKFNLDGINGFINRLKSSLGNTLKRGTKVKWFNLDVEVKLVPLIKDRYIRDADVTIATAWPTAYDVYNLSEEKGDKFYLIQHYEEWSGPIEEVDGSYRLPLKHIVIAKWIYDLMKTKFNKEKDIYLVYNGINFDEFNCSQKEIKKKKTVAMLYHKLEWKGYKDGLIAFENARRKYGENLKLKLFGTEYGEDIPQYAEFYLNPDKDTLRKIYCDSEIFIYPSRNEGWGLTPMEAMACKCVVIGSNTGCISEIGEDNKNCMIVQPGDIESLTDKLINIVNNENLIENIGNAGYKTVSNFSWNKSVDKFEKIIKNKYTE